MDMVKLLPPAYRTFAWNISALTIMQCERVIVNTNASRELMPVTYNRCQFAPSIFVHGIHFLLRSNITPYIYGVYVYAYSHRNGYQTKLMAAAIRNKQDVFGLLGIEYL
ncbi:unnamed protein product [Urochloa humidicola]